jgi:hypothetical protein
VSSTSVANGDSVTVKWQVENAASVQISALAPGNLAAQGTMSVPLTKTTTFQLMVNGSPLAQLNVEVHDKPKLPLQPQPQPQPGVSDAGPVKPSADLLQNALKPYLTWLSGAAGKNCKAALTSQYDNKFAELAKNWCGDAKSFAAVEKCSQAVGGTADAPTLSCEETITVRPKEGDPFPIGSQKTFRFKKVSEGTFQLLGW